MPCVWNILVTPFVVHILSYPSYFKKRTKEGFIAIFVKSLHSKLLRAKEKFHKIKKWGLFKFIPNIYGKFGIRINYIFFLLPR